MAKETVTILPEYRPLAKETEMSKTPGVSEIPDDIVAAIAGAIAVICGEARIKSIRPASRSAWAAAGAANNTTSF